MQHKDAVRSSHGGPSDAPPYAVQVVAGHRVMAFETVGSTNDEAMRLLSEGERGPVWVTAHSQTTGRGREGRRWHSRRGNLLASLLFVSSAPLRSAPELSFVAGLAVYDAAAAMIAPEKQDRLRLKWPNDLMLDGAKAGGILVETAFLPNENALAAVLGIGMNLVSAPQDMGRAVSNLGLLSADLTVETCLVALADAMARWLLYWNEGQNFALIRGTWLDRAHVIGDKLTVRLNGTAVHGSFHGMDVDGALQLRAENGDIIAIAAGDVSVSALRDDHG